MFKRFYLIFFIVLIQLTTVRTYAIDTEISKIRMKKIAEIIRRYTRANEKLSDPYVKEAIFDEVDKALTLEPEAKPNEKSVKEIAKIVRKKVLKRFPYSIKTIKAKAEKKAKKKFTMAQKLEPVTIKVQKGRTSYSVSGIFYGHGLGGQSARIGDNAPIAYYDMTEDSRAQFDKKYCTRIRRNYIDEKVRNYYRQKGSYANKLFKEIRSKISIENESIGYIYAWNKWRTPKNVTEYLIQKIESTLKPETELTAQMPKDENDQQAKLDEDTKPSLLEEKPTDIKIDSHKLKIGKIKRAIEEKQLEISGSQYGIDADQGYNKKDKRIIWGMSQENANLLFQDEPNVIKGNNSTTIEYKNGAVKSVVLSFVNGIFFKAHINYTIGPKEGMMILWQRLNEKYGESNESKVMNEANVAREERMAAIANLCQPDEKGKETHKFSKGKCTICKALQSDIHPPPPPLEQTFTWKGKITHGTLDVKLSQDRSTFDAFSLVKENVNIEEAQKNILKTKQKLKEEEEKKLELEKYRKSLE